MERLFGRKTKKTSTSSNPLPVSPTVTNEDEGFSIVSHPASIYPNVSPAPQYPVVNTLPASNSPVVTQASVSSSSGASAYLEGVPFVLNTRCSGGSDLDAVLARVESIAERIRNVDWQAADYDFRLERSVLSQESMITDSLQRLHAN